MGTSNDRDKIAQRLNDQRPSELPPCKYVNSSKHQYRSVQVQGKYIWRVSFLHWQSWFPPPNLTLRGLMSIPQTSLDYQSQLNAFSQLAELKDKLAANILILDTLSMGMSAWYGRSSRGWQHHGLHWNRDFWCSWLREVTTPNNQKSLSIDTARFLTA